MRLECLLGWCCWRWLFFIVFVFLWEKERKRLGKYVMVFGIFVFGGMRFGFFIKFIFDIFEEIYNDLYEFVV